MNMYFPVKVNLRQVRVCAHVYILVFILGKKVQFLSYLVNVQNYDLLFSN